MKIYEDAFRKCYQWLVEEGYVQQEEISTERISRWLGMNSIEMWNSFQPDLDEEVKGIASNKIGEEMLKGISEGKAVWYDGTEEMLESLLTDGYKMVILSNCKKAYKEQNWKNFRMERWFEEFFDCESFGFAPKEEIIQAIQAKYPGTMIIIGDRASDLKAAKPVEGKTIGCSYGYGSEEELADADLTACSVKEVAEKVRLLTKA
jgi:phosphoglycolate phosphatase